MSSQTTPSTTRAMIGLAMLAMTTIMLALLVMLADCALVAVLGRMGVEPPAACTYVMYGALGVAAVGAAVALAAFGVHERARAKSRREA